MDYLNKIKSTVSSVAAQVSQNVSQALPGNPIFREYTVLMDEQMASAGPGLCWRIFSATKNSTKERVSVWLFEKKFMDNWSKPDREQFLELVKRGVSQLTRIRHPRVLTVQRGLEETRDNLAFCTEPVHASVANLLGHCDNITPKTPKHLREHELIGVEVKYGLFQLIEALRFLQEARIVHANLGPHSVLVNERGEWRLAGFEFNVQGKQGETGTTIYDVPRWEQRMALLSPELNFTAPEFCLDAKLDPAVDIFSLGMLIHALYNKGRPAFDCLGSLNQYRQHAEKLKNASLPSIDAVPDGLREETRLCLSFVPSLRPDAAKLADMTFLRDDSLLRVLEFLDRLNAMDQAQKMKFFKGLTSVLPQFPKRFLLQKMMPTLADGFTLSAMLVPFILPNVFLIAEMASAAEFETKVLPPLIPVFSMNEPYQIPLLLLEKAALFVDKMPAKEVKANLFPLVFTSLAPDRQSTLQELCLTEVPRLIPFVDKDAMRLQLLPRLLQLALAPAVQLSIRVQTLLCIAKLMPKGLEPWMVHDQVLPSLPKIPGRESGLLMAILGLYKLAHDTEKFGIPRQLLARSVLPHLISVSVESTLNAAQFDQFMALIHALLTKLEAEQRQRLAQLSVGEREQKSINEFVEGALAADPAALGATPSQMPTAFSTPSASADANSFVDFMDAMAAAGVDLGSVGRQPVAAATAAADHKNGFAGGLKLPHQQHSTLNAVPPQTTAPFQPATTVAGGVSALSLVASVPAPPAPTLMLGQKQEKELALLFQSPPHPPPSAQRGAAQKAQNSSNSSGGPIGNNKSGGSKEDDSFFDLLMPGRSGGNIMLGGSSLGSQSQYSSLPQHVSGWDDELGGSGFGVMSNATVKKSTNTATPAFRSGGGGEGATIAANRRAETDDLLAEFLPQPSSNSRTTSSAATSFGTKSVGSGGGWSLPQPPAAQNSIRPQHHNAAKQNNASGNKASLMAVDPFVEAFLSGGK